MDGQDGIEIWRAALFVGGIGMASGIIGGGASGWFFHERTQINRIITQRIERTIVRNVAAPPLDDPKKACSGAPVEIINIYSNNDKPKKGQSMTWMSVRPVNDNYIVACGKAGWYSDLWKSGQIVRVYGGHVDED